MSKKHITFDSIDCPHLQYIKTASCWVCLDRFIDLKEPDFCMMCKFEQLRLRERGYLFNG